jgi:hypothetical protein
LPWFARLHDRWTAWKATLMSWLHATPAWQWSQMLVERLRRAP